MNQKSRTEYSVLNMVTGLGGYFFNIILGYICRMIFVRCLSQEYLGINGLFSNILSMLSLVELGIGSAMGYALYQPLAKEDKEKIASLMALYKKSYTIIGIIVAVLGIMMIPLLQFIIVKPAQIVENIYTIYLVYLFNTASSYFFSYRGALLIAAQRNYIVTGINYLITTIVTIIQIPILICTHNYMLYLICQTVGGLINNIVVSAWTKHDYPYIEKKSGIKPLSLKEKKEMFINVKALTINKLAAMLVNNTDNIVITYFNGLISTGVISNYTLLIGTLGSITSQLFNGITASVGNLNAVEDNEKKYDFFCVLNLANFWIYGWCAIGIALISNEIIKICFGQSYIVGMKIPLVLAMNFYLVGMNNAVLIYKNTMGLFQYGQYLLILTAIINLTLDIVLGRKWGMFGIFLATIIARIVTNTWYEPYAVFKYGLNKNFYKYIKKFVEYFFVLIITGGICYFLCACCKFNNILNLVLKITVCSIIPNFSFLACYGRSNEGKKLISLFVHIRK
ncbi:lipopolysaccharide biosynthesis protein [Anaerostipes faecalis]|uniref:lipopolysaccharide biosynthesis protein n=1 Tax=Anaerostipes faecalis TaxID=2738446 RepID=UPI003EFC94D7